MNRSTLSALALSAVFCLPGCTKKFAENIPEGCPDNNSITVTSKEVASFTLKQAWFSTWTGKDGSLIFTSYDDFDPASIYGHDVTGSEARVVIKLKNADGSNVGKARYEATYKKDKKPAHQVSEFNVSTEKLAGGVFDSNGYVDFTYFGTDFTCGTIKADDGRSKIEGTFITHYKKVN